jgi:phage shock protein PspC (stress-responsive transcriptional regulator)
MKRTVKINLAGMAFTLDEDAYQLLKTYLDQINAYFKDLEGGDEIISDIESRFAEIFQSKIEDKREIISIEDVEQVIEIMGQPEDILDSETANGREQAGGRYSSRKQNRKYYRDPENAILGGVAAGLAAYFGIEAWIVRVIWIVLFIPVQLMAVLYIILWIVVPKAVTPAQRLEMRGEEVTVKNMEKKVKEEYQNVRENVKRASKSKEFEKTRNVLDEIFHVLGKIVVVFLKIIVIIIGVAFILAGLSALMALTGAFAFSHTFFPLSIHDMHFYSIREFCTFFMHPGSVTIFSVCLFFIILIPLVALIYGGLKMILRFKANDRVIALTGLVLWVISFFFLVATLFFESSNYVFSGPHSTTETEQLDEFTSDTLFIKMNPDPDLPGFDGGWYNEDGEERFTISEYAALHKKINLNIRISDDDDYEIVLYRKTVGRSRLTTRYHNISLEYFWLQEENSLVLDPHFTKRRAYRSGISAMEVTVFVPEGKYIHLDKNTRYFLDDVEGVPDSGVMELAGETFLIGGDDTYDEVEQ